MATVSLCRRCGYVNQWKLKSCVVCGSRLATRIQPGRSDPWNEHRDKASRSPPHRSPPGKRPGLHHFAVVVFLHDTLGVISDAIRLVEWLIRAGAEAIGRATSAPYVIEARPETGLSLFWKVSRRRPVVEAIDEVFQAMSIGDLDFQSPNAQRLEVE